MSHAYSDIQAQLQRVRRAWKRAAALQGLSAVFVETLGMLLVFAAIDYAYATPPHVRLMILGCICVIASALFVRQVMRPLMRDSSEAVATI